MLVVVSVSALIVAVAVLAAIVSAEHHSHSILGGLHDDASASSLRKNVVFKPLDPKVTNPAEFWTPVQNPVPNSYCSRPRYPVVPTIGDIAMANLWQLYPNGTVPHVPAKPTNVWQKNLWGFNWSDHTNWGGVYPYPYIVQPRSQLISLMYSGAPRNLTGNRAMQQGFTKPAARAPKGNPPVRNASYPWMTMSGGFDFAVRVENGNKPQLSKVDELSAQVDFEDAKNASVASLYIVKGSPFVTLKCTNAVLKFGGPQKGPYVPIVGINGLPPGSKVTGTVFKFHVAEGPMHPEAKEWHAFFTAPVTITLANPPTLGATIRGRGAGGAYTGLLKLASGEMDDAQAQWLQSIAHTVATGAEVQYDIDDKTHQSVVRFKWQTIGPGPLTMLALPHHMKLFSPSDIRKMNATTTKYWCVKGNMSSVTANEWNMNYNLSTVGFGEDLKIQSAAHKATIKKAALFDYELRIDRCPGDNDTYNGTEGVPGYKNMELYAYARDLAQYTEVAIVLENLGLRTHAVNLTKKALECVSWIYKTPEALPKPCPPPINNTLQCVRNMMDVYFDEKWGGLITGWYDRFAMHYCQCDKPGGPNACKGLNYCDNPRAWDGFANYGNAFYNDHHFQYGYILRVAAWAIYFQETLGAPLDLSKKQIANLTTQSLAFARDIANPDAVSDKYFTFLRHKDMYDGHSWAEGYDYSGRMLVWINQQTGSEAVNAYLGVYLLGRALNDTNVEDWGRINMATEAFSIHTYQHLVNDTEFERDQPTPEISKWGRALSILIGNGASGATYFGPNPLFETAITLLPLSVYSKEWLRPTWAREAAKWIRARNNGTGVCVFFNPLNKSQVGHNPCPGPNHTKSFEGNAWGCCPVNEGYPLNQWREYPEWTPYLYILDAIAGDTEAAFEKLSYDGDFTKPTEHLLFPYVNKQKTVVGYEHDLTLTQALFFVATEKKEKK